MKDVIATNAPWIPKFLIPSIFNSRKRIKDISCPTLVIHGDKDDLVPVSQGKQLYAELKSPKVMAIIEGAGHNDIGLYNRYYAWVIDFITNPNIEERHGKSQI